MIRTTIALLLVASPAVGQTFAVPAGCEAYLTIQSTSCTVSHYFKCEDDPVGHQRRADLDEDGLAYVGRIDSEAQWIESFQLRGGFTERLRGSVDEMSLSELIANGEDSFDFETESREIGVTRYVGQDRLTGVTVEIDGIVLQQTEYSIRSLAEDGTEIWRSSGNEFISTDWRMFLSGVSSYETSSDSFESDDTPVEFIFPGEAGFLSVNPKHGCGAMMSSADPYEQATQG